MLKKPWGPVLANTSDRDLKAFRKAHDAAPDIVAYKALERILGKDIYDARKMELLKKGSDGINSGHWGVDENGMLPPELDRDYLDKDGWYLHLLNYRLYEARAENRTEERISRAKDDLDKAKKYFKKRSLVSKAFYNEIAEVRSTRNKGHLLYIAQDYHPANPPDQLRLTKVSVARWSKKYANVDIPEWEACSPITDSADETNPKPYVPITSWQGVEVKIYADNRIGYFVNGRHIEIKHFSDIGLLNKRTKKPNTSGQILTGLSEGRKFPAEPLKNKHSTAISRVRDALEELTGITQDPFLEHNPADGFKPRFKLIDDRKNADDRARRLAEKRSSNLFGDDVHNPPRPKFERGKDAGGAWLDENDYG